MKWRRIALLIAVSVAFALFAFWIWDATTPIPLVEIIWVAPKAIEDCASYDTDGDRYEDALILKADQWWQLRIVDGQWQAEPLPVPPDYDLVGLTFLNSPILLFKDPQDLIWVMQYREGWVLRPSTVKYSPPLSYDRWLLYDLDRDGQEDDLVMQVMEGSKNARWFKLQTDGSLVLKDELPLPLGTTPDDIFAWQGKLQVVKGVMRQVVKIPDIDGDGVMEQMAIKVRTHRESGLELMTSRKNKMQRLKVPIALDTFMLGFEKAVDINGDGWQEIILLGERNRQTFLLLLHCDSANWRSEIVPFRLVDNYPDIFIMQVGRSKRLVLFSAYKGECQMIWYDGRKWRERRWRFKSYPILICWEEKGMWRMLIVRHIWLDNYPLWRFFSEWCFKLQDWGLPVPIPPEAIYWAEVWKWDEKRFDWRLEGSFTLGGCPDLNHTNKALDLNGDGHKELLVVEEHSHTFATIAVKVRKWRTKWKSVNLQPDSDLFELSDGKRIWLVSVKPPNLLQAWTLK